MICTKFRYESVFALASLQFCGHVDEYLIANTRRLCLMYVLPRFGAQKQIIRRYEEGKLNEHFEYTRLYADVFKPVEELWKR